MADTKDIIELMIANSSVTNYVKLSIDIYDTIGI